MTNFRSADLLLERAIEVACQRTINEPNESRALAAFHCMREMVRQRSEAQVRRLEKRRTKL